MPTITPKSPEILLAEFDYPLHTFENGIATNVQNREWLKTSLLSLLEYVESQMSQSLVTEPEYYRGWNDGLKEARTIIRQEMEKIEKV